MSSQKTLLALFLTLFACAAFAGQTVLEWPTFRGPKRDGVSTETGLLKTWPAGGPTLVWTGKGMGGGYSSVSAAGGKIFTMGDKEGSSNVLALNPADGGILWTAKVGKPGGNYAGTRCTPTVDGPAVYALGQMGELVCLQAADGKEVWRKNMQTDFGGKMAEWNFTESVLIDGNFLVCTPGGSKGTMVALDKKTGEKIWQSSEVTDNAHYSSVVPADIGGVHQYIQLTAASVFAIDARSGKLAWRAVRKGATAVIPTPVVYEDFVFVTSGYGVGHNCFRITGGGGGAKATPVYAGKDMINHHGGVIRVGEHVYGHSDSGDWTCLEMKTGKVMWQERGVAKGAVAYADGNLYCRSEGGKGTIALVSATPEGYKENGRFDQPNRAKENSWPHPVICNGRLYIRDQDVLLCYDVKAR